MPTLTALTQMPDQLTAGTTWLVQRTYSDYPASAGWTVKFNFVNATTALAQQTCSAVGDDHLLTVAASVTVGFAAGTYAWQAVATSNDATPLVAVAETGTLEVLADLAVAGASDQRSHAAKVLASVEALLEGKADVEEFDIRTGTTVRRLKSFSPEQLMKLRDRYKALVLAEQMKADNARGIKRSRLRYGVYSTE